MATFLDSLFCAADAWCASKPTARRLVEKLRAAGFSSVGSFAFFLAEGVDVFGTEPLEPGESVAEAEELFAYLASRAKKVQSFEEKAKYRGLDPRIADSIEDAREEGRLRKRPRSTPSCSGAVARFDRSFLKMKCAVSSRPGSSSVKEDEEKRHK